MRLPCALLGLLLLPALPAAAAVPTWTIARASGPIAVDGDLSDPGWNGALTIEGWYETNPGDNVPPRVRNVGRLAYDGAFLYAGFEFDDPEPGRIRAPFGERDSIGGGLDYGGLILDPRHDGKTAILFLANPRGIQYDAINSDLNGGSEDDSPDWFWDSAARITERGWVLEIRIPFSSLRYSGEGPQTWGLMLYRNWPRDHRYQMFSVPLPRSSNCFICNQGTLTGLEGLPPGGGWVLAPYATGSRDSAPGEDARSDGEGGIDAKWAIGADTVLDAAVNPDFSQVESDVAQISANERFGLFYPEKRPFFLESVDFLTTPMRAVSTRTITDPAWGLRGTGRVGATSWTALVADDEGGGSVLIPGTDSSGFAPQDFRSRAGIARVRHDLGRSFVSLLATDREIEGGASNRVLGPDAQWKPNDRVTFSGQILWSRSRTPERPDLAAEWDGRELSGHAAQAWAYYNDERYDLFAEYKDLSEGFRADLGFIPQVGIREVYGETGRTWRPTGFLTRVRAFVEGDRTEDRDGGLVFKGLWPGVGMDTRWNGQVRLQGAFEEVRTVGGILPRTRGVVILQASPTRRVPSVGLEASFGEDIDVEFGRAGHGTRLEASASLRPTDHLELSAVGEWRTLDVPYPATGVEGRALSAAVERLRATYTFDARTSLRLIVQDVRLDRTPAAYPVPVEDRTESLALSALLSYRLNWQSVVFAGWEEGRSLDAADSLEVTGRRLFLKVSYAFIHRRKNG